MQNHETHNDAAPKPTAWNKGKLIGPKPPLRPKRVWAILAGSRAAARDDGCARGLLIRSTAVRDR
jgi:hypothetical protein